MEDERNKVKEPQLCESKAKPMEELEMESVIARARNHDAAALSEIYLRYVRRVLGLCRYMLNSQESAEDATSEVFLKLQRLIDGYDGSVPFSNWLLHVAGNQCLDVLRRRKRQRQVIVKIEDEAVVPEPSSPELSPLGSVIGAEEKAAVRDAIARLPENYRIPLVLRYYSELSYEEIAQQLGLQRNYVAALIFRAKQDLRRKLARGSK